MQWKLESVSGLDERFQVLEFLGLPVGLIRSTMETEESCAYRQMRRAKVVPPTKCAPSHNL
eukprot:6463113-Amphidinium_carterae.1